MATRKRPLKRGDILSRRKKGTTTWTDSKGTILQGRAGTREKAGQNIKRVRGRQRVMTKASQLASNFAEGLGGVFTNKPRKRSRAKR